MYALRKTTTLTLALAVMLALLFGVLTMVGGKPAGAQTEEVPPAEGVPDVDPDFVAGNPSCATQGYDFEVKADPPNSGTYTDGTLTVTVVSDGTYFNWTSNIGVDAVIAKGGPNANAYVYDPPGESLGDDGLHSPINPNTGQPFGLSHISFCYDLELEVEKTAETSFKQTNTWDIAKTVTPDKWELFTGDSGTSTYTVTLDKTVTESDYAVTGTISVHNPAGFDANVTSVTDEISGVGAADVDCGESFPITVAAGDTLNCTYSSALPDKEDRTNTATATTDTENLGDGTGEAKVTFDGTNPTVVGPATVTVDDSFEGDLGSFSNDGSATYDRTFTCDEDEGQHDNTATINETGQSASASVDVQCYDLTVTKDADTSLERKWNWTVVKKINDNGVLKDQLDLLLSIGQTYDVSYRVTYDATSTDSKWKVEGNITVTNNAPIDATLNSVSDVIQGVGDADVDCGESFPYTLAAGDTLDCTYSADLPDAETRLNTATATIQNYDYDSDKIGTPSGTTDFTGTANVDFTNATVTEIDEQITVSDDNQGTNVTGTVSASEVPKVFNYLRPVGPYDACGEQPPIVNTAKFVTNDTGTEGTDSATVNVNVPCDGCTLTIGYWKTHAGFTGNNADAVTQYLPIWLGTAGGTKSVQVTTATQAVKILNFNGDASNGINKLYAQLLGAKLNIANGADDSAIASTISAADAFLATKNASSWSSLSKADKNKVLGWATKLDNYNNGLIGPGHCSENPIV